MKNLYLTLIATFIVVAGFAQNHPFFITEYVEGWSNNKAIEIFNATDQPQSLSGYGLQRYQNGSQAPGFTTNLYATIAPYDVYVVVLDKRDPNGTGLEAPVWDSLQARADTFVTPNYNGGSEAMYFNGNDAVVLVKIGTPTDEVVDIVGKVGEDPGEGWGAYTDGGGSPAAWTKDHTMRRKSSVTTGITVNPVTFDPSVEWDSLPANTFDGLGMHTCDNCQVGIKEINEQRTLGIYPNPVLGDFFFVKAQSPIEKMEIFDVVGKLLLTRKAEVDAPVMKVNTLELPEGVYLIKVKLANGGELVRKVVVN